MSLVKDEQISIAVVGTVSYTGVPGNPAYNTYKSINFTTPQSSFYIPLEYAGHPGYSMPIKTTGIDNSIAGRQLRMCTAAEIKAMREIMFPNYPPNTQIDKIEEIRRYYRNFGIPVSMVTSTIFISVWWFEQGPAFAIFVGYDPMNPPRQYIKLRTSSTGVIIATRR